MELKNSEKEMKLLHTELERMNELIRTASAELESLRAERDDLSEKRMGVEMQRIQAKERREGMEKERSMVEQIIQETRRQRKDLQLDRTRSTAMGTEMENQLRGMMERTAGFLQKRSDLAIAIREMEAQVEEKRNEFHSRKEETHKGEEILELARKKLEDLRIEERGGQVKLDALIEKSREEINLDLPVEYERMRSTPDLDRDWEAVAKEIEEIRAKLSRMGSVNLEAIHELEEVEERYSGLVEQRDDLLKSIKGLEELIVDLNKESREKFLETFEAVKEHFNQIFRKLFQGGKAEIKLREDGDMLDAGIDIIAGPPGKDFRSISLLSGGEKSLTAVGLLFALFTSRPSPFCILDEVDAALDEVNIERFCNLLGDYTKNSQFLIVTHSKRTMSFCNSLYGITMQEDGVSTQISLNLETYREQVA
jgi:chromosome segregation protein